MRKNKRMRQTIEGKRVSNTVKWKKIEPLCGVYEVVAIFLKELSGSYRRIVYCGAQIGTCANGLVVPSYKMLLEDHEEADIVVLPMLAGGDVMQVAHEYFDYNNEMVALGLCAQNKQTLTVTTAYAIGY